MAQDASASISVSSAIEPAVHLLLPSHVEKTSFGSSLSPSVKGGQSQSRGCGGTSADRTICEAGEGTGHLLADAKSGSVTSLSFFTVWICSDTPVLSPSCSAASLLAPSPLKKSLIP